MLAPLVTLPTIPTPEDLAPTEDVQITEEIKALANSLGNNPMQIYNWVHDHIEFLPTYGSIQGSHLTLQTKRGNAFDTASLLIALLRAANIHARYVLGTVQIPIDTVMNWVGGATVPEAALQVLGQGGIPHVALVQGGTIIAVKLEHVWVEAWVDFEPSRGATHRQGDTWIPLDVSFKQYQYTSGMNLPDTVPFDAQTSLAQMTAPAQVNPSEAWVSGFDHPLIQNMLTTFQEQISTAVTTQQLGATVGDVVGTKRIIPMRRPVLAAGLPYQLVVRGLTVRLFPDHLRHKFRFTLYASPLEQLSEIPALTFQQSLPSLAGKPLTLSFTPATQADAEVITSSLPHPPADGAPLDLNTLPRFLPGYLIRLVAELHVDGQVVARGGQFMMGQVLVSTAALYDPLRGWQEEENTPPVAGEYQALAINAAGIAASQVQTLQTALTDTKAKLDVRDVTGLTADDVAGALLSSVVVSYFVVTDTLGEIQARAAGMLEYRRPSFGSFTAKVQPRLLFGIPWRVTFPGLELDITRLDSLMVSAANDRPAQVAYMRQSGIRQSALEHLLPEQLFSTAQQPREAVSAVKALTIASSQGQRLYLITSETVASVLPQLTIDPDVKTEILAAVATGKQAMVSQHEITVGDWTGVGYIIVDPETGAGAYQISGGAHGAFLIGLSLALTLVVTIAVILAPELILLAYAAQVLSLLGFFKVLREWETFDWPCFWQGAAVTLGVVVLIWGILLLHSVSSIYALTAKILDAEPLLVIFTGLLSLVIGATLPTKTIQTCLTD